MAALNGIGKRKLVDMLQETDNSAEIHRIISRSAEADEDAPMLNLSSLKKKVLKTEKCITNNQSMRIKFADDPKRFMSSEISLNEAIQDLSELSTAPSLFGHFVKLGALESLLSLLSHANIDIMSAVLNLIRDLVDIDSAEDEKGRRILVSAILKLDGLSLIVQSLERLNEKEEEDYETFGNTLSAFESMIESDSDVASKLSTDTSVLKLLCQRSARSIRTHDQNRFDSAEILSVILLNGGESSRTKFCEDPECFRLLFETLHTFISRDPLKGDETEFVENLFDSLTCVLLVPGTRDAFGDLNGISFLIESIRSKKFVRHCALKALNLALEKCPPNCVRFVDAGGLKCIFAALMKGESKRHKKYNVSVDEEEENIVCVLAHLFMFSSGARYERVRDKFEEANCQKLDRIVELHIKFAEKIAAHETDEREEDEESLQSGVYGLRMLDLVMAFVLTAGVETISTHLRKLCDQYDISLDTIKLSLKELKASIGEDDKKSETDAKNGQFQIKVIDSLLVMIE